MEWGCVVMVVAMWAVVGLHHGAVDSLPLLLSLPVVCKQLTNFQMRWLLRSKQ